MTRVSIDFTDSITPMKVGDSQATASPGRRIARAASVSPWRAPLVTIRSERSSGAPRCSAEDHELVDELGQPRDIGVLQRAAVVALERLGQRAPIGSKGKSSEDG